VCGGGGGPRRGPGRSRWANSSSRATKLERGVSAVGRGPSDGGGGGGPRAPCGDHSNAPPPGKPHNQERCPRDFGFEYCRAEFNLAVKLCFARTPKSLKLMASGAKKYFYLKRLTYLKFDNAPRPAPPRQSNPPSAPTHLAGGEGPPQGHGGLQAGGPLLAVEGPRPRPRAPQPPGGATRPRTGEGGGGGGIPRHTVPDSVPDSVPPSS